MCIPDQGYDESLPRMGVAESKKIIKIFTRKMPDANYFEFQDI